MALTTTSPVTLYNNCDSTTGWTGGGAIDTDEKIQGTGCIGADVDIETVIFIGPTITAINMSATKYAIYPWVKNFTAAYLDTKANGGLFGVLTDGTNSSYWYCGGEDTYPGGWEVLAFNTGKAPDGNSGTAADLTAITNIGFGYKGLQKSKLADNSFIDYIRYSSSTALKITGTNTVTDDGWSEILTDDIALIAGVIKAQAGSYKVKGPIQIGDDSGTLATTFTDDGGVIIFDDAPVGDLHYSLNCLGNATGATNVTLNGQFIKGVSGRFEFDQSDANLTSFTLTGSTIELAGLSTFKSGQTVTGDVFANCLQIAPSTSTFNNNTIKEYTGTEGGAVLLASNNTNNCTFISAGTGHAIYITSPGTYTLTNMLYTGYGATTSTDAVVYNNSGGAVTLNISGGDTPTYRNGTAATTTVSQSVTLSMIVKDEAGAVIVGAFASIHDYTGSPEVEIMNTTTAAVTGLATTAWTGGAVTGSIWRVRKYGYKPYRASVDIGSTDISIPVTLIADPQQT